MRLILFEFDRYFDSIRFFLKNDSKRRSAIPVLVEFVAEQLSVCGRFRQQRKTTLPQEIISSKIGVERGRKPYARPCFSASRKRVYADVIASHNYSPLCFFNYRESRSGQLEGNTRETRGICIRIFMKRFLSLCVVTRLSTQSSLKRTEFYLLLGIS